MMSLPTDTAPVDARAFAISDGEVNFILGFLHDGSIGAEPWHRLIGAWGYCERHAWASLTVEMAVLKGFLSRSAFLYFDLLRQAVETLAPQAVGRRAALRRHLGERNACMICEVNPHLRGRLSDAEIAEARDPSRLRKFAEELAPFWQTNCCPRCLEYETNGRLCRRHLKEAIEGKLPIGLEDNHRYLCRLLPRVQTYARSFMYEHRGTDGPEDRAALLSAIGWCSGWSTLAALVDIDFPPRTHRGESRLEGKLPP